VLHVQAALIFRYGRPWAGREKLAFEAFGDALEFFGKRAADGLCQAPIAYMAATGGGMMMVHGDRERLAEILQTEDFMHMYLRAGYAVPDLTYDLMLAGESAVNQMGMWAGVGSELGLF
jgi:4-hydroxy-L-threonine phosphate dehydrogenase PdxA